MHFAKKIQEIKKQNLIRNRVVNESAQAVNILVNGKKLINFCSNDYLGLANNEKIKEAAIQGIKKYGIGSGGSHLVSGHFKVHQELEEILADFTKQEKALLFSSGYSANLGIFSALKDDLDWILQDKLNHASLIDANKLTQIPIRRYLHNNINSLENKIKKRQGSGLIVTDNIFSMDGNGANIDKIANIANKSQSLFMQDDAHGFGVFTANIPDNSIYMATLGKAAGTAGAFVAGNADFINYLIQKSRPYIYTTAISPSLCYATIKSIELIKNGEQKNKLLTNITFFKDFAKRLKLNFQESKSAIQPIIIKDNEKTLAISNKLMSAGFYVKAIRPPTVPPNTARLRFTLCAEHTKKQIEQVLKALKNAMV